MFSAYFQRAPDSIYDPYSEDVDWVYSRRIKHTWTSRQSLMFLLNIVPMFNLMFPSDAIWRPKSFFLFIYVFRLIGPTQLPEPVPLCFQFMNSIQWNLNKMRTCSIKKMRLKMPSTKHQPFCLGLNELTHWGRVTLICVSKLTIIGSDNGLSPGRRQAIIWINAGILLIGPLGTNFS